jgi:septal ring factor EnvC (AmiA/AmiB activator)
MTQVVEYSVTDANLTELAEKYAVVPDATTDGGYQAIKECLRETTPLRTAVEKRRKELKKDALEYGRKVDTEAKRITKALVDIETPYRDAKQVVDDEVARIEQEKREAEADRITLLTNRISFIQHQTEGLLGADAKAIQARIDWLYDNANLDTFEEFTDQAELANNQALESLNKALADRVEMDRQAAEQSRIAKEQADKQAELDKQAEEQRKQQAKIEAERAEAARIMKEAQNKAEAEKRAAEAKKLAAERAEAEKVRKEKERLEAEKREAEEQQRLKEAAEAEAIRQEELRPDREKLEKWAEEIRNYEFPSVTSDKARAIVEAVIRNMEKTANLILEKSKEL